LGRDEPSIIETVRSTRTYDLIAYSSRETIPEIGLLHVAGKDALIAMIRANDMDDILLVHTDYGQGELQEIFEMARIYGVGYRYVTNRFEAEKSNTELSFV